MSVSTQFSNPVYESLKGEDPHSLSLKIVDENPFYETDPQTSSVKREI